MRISLIIVGRHVLVIARIRRNNNEPPNDKTPHHVHIRALARITAPMRANKLNGSGFWATVLQPAGAHQIRYHNTE